MQVNGLIYKVGKVEQISDNFSKRDFVLEMDHDKQYPQFILFQLANARTSLIDKFKEGDHVSVDFNLRGKKFTDKQGEEKSFNNLDAWKIEAVNPS